MGNSTELESKMKLWVEFIEKQLLEEPTWLPVVYTICMSIIFVVSLIGNLLTCVVIYSDKSMHTATNYYLFHLAVSDSVVTLSMLLEFFLTDEQYPTYIYGELTCKIHFFLILSLWNNGILIMTALAIERYVAICYPLMLQSAPVWRRVMKVTCAIWAIAIAETLPEMWTISISKTNTTSICYAMPNRYTRYLNGLLAVVTFLIPLGIMIFVYSMIAYQINLVQKNYNKDMIFNHRDNRSRVNKLIIALTLAFLVCWVPFFTIRILMFSIDVEEFMRYSNWFIILVKISCLNGWFSAVLNPLLFSLMSTKFRNALKTLWNRKVKCRKPQGNTTRATMI